LRKINPPAGDPACSTNIPNSACLNNRDLQSLSCDAPGELLNFTYVVKGCNMVAISTHIDMYFYYYEYIGTILYVNMQNGNDTALQKNFWENPDYIIGDLFNNELRSSVSIQKNPGLY
jgi:hypothetical protein